MRNKHKFAILFFLILFGTFFVMIYKSRVGFRNLAIEGRIEAIKYDTLKFQGKTKGINYTTASIPNIKVNNLTFVLLPNLSFKKKVQVGDSIIKLKGERNVKIIKKNDHKIVVFEF